MDIQEVDAEERANYMKKADDKAIDDVEREVVHGFEGYVGARGIIETQEHSRDNLHNEEHEQEEPVYIVRIYA